MSDDTSARVKLREMKILSDRYYTLNLASFDFLRGDGTWQHQERESYDIGDAAAVLPIDQARDRVLLITQFSWTAIPRRIVSRRKRWRRRALSSPTRSWCRIVLSAPAR